VRENMTAGGELIRAGLWRWTKGVGLERFELLRIAEEWVMRGTILVLAEVGPAKPSARQMSRPAEARYEVVCGGSWQTKRAEVTVRDGAGERVARVALQDGRWYENGRANEVLRGCCDIDLEWSPSTNTLPIRRLGLAIGETSGAITAAWLRFPELILEPLAQEYHRVSERRYRYTSGGGVFTAGIVVDEDGLVLDYEGGWQRVRERE
jgi:uncharacterized protein